MATLGLAGESYLLRVRKVNEIYDRCMKGGVSNRNIYRAYIYPQFGISERTFYNYLKRGLKSGIR